LLPGLRRRPQIEVGRDVDLSVEERPRSSQEEESFLEGEFGKNNIPIAIPLFSDEIFKKIPKESSSDKKDISVKFGQFDVIVPGREENKIEDNIIKDYNDDFPAEYQYDYGSDEELIANYDIARVIVKATSTEAPYQVESSNIVSSGEAGTSEGGTSKPEFKVTPEAAATSTSSEKLETFVQAASTEVPAKVNEESTANKLDTSKKVDSVKSGEKKKKTEGFGKKGPQIASTESPGVAKEGADETAKQGEAAEKKGAAKKESTAAEAKNGPNATDNSEENIEEVEQKSLTRGQLTVATTEKIEPSVTETESQGAVKTSEPFSRFKSTVSAGTSSETDEKSSVTIPSVFRFLPTLSSGRRDRPSLRERAKALRAITTLSKALRTSTQSTSEEAGSSTTIRVQKKSTPSPVVLSSPTPISQPPVQLKETIKESAEPDKRKEAEADEEERLDTQERGLKGDSSASAVTGAPLLRDPMGAVWKTDANNQLSSKPNAETGEGETDVDHLSKKKGETDVDQLSKAQLQEKLRLLQEKLAKLATDAEVLTKKPTTTSTTQSTTTQSSSSLVTGPIKVVKVTTPPPRTLSSQQQPTRAPTTQVKATTLPGQQETKFPNFPTSGVQDELRAAVEAGLRNLGSFVIWSDSPRVVPPPTRPSPVFRPSRRVDKVN